MQKLRFLLLRAWIIGQESNDSLLSKHFTLIILQITISTRYNNSMISSTPCSSLFPLLFLSSSIILCIHHSVGDVYSSVGMFTLILGQSVLSLCTSFNQSVSCGRCLLRRRGLRPCSIFHAFTLSLDNLGTCLLRRSCCEAMSLETTVRIRIIVRVSYQAVECCSTQG